MHKATIRFWKIYDSLPEHVQKIAKRNFDLLKVDPLHPSLHFKKIGNFWQFEWGLTTELLQSKMARISFGGALHSRQ